MLVLSRKMNEQLVIDDRIVITVLEVKGSRVKLGITAPTNVPIQRGEIAFDGPVPATRRVPRDNACFSASELPEDNVSGQFALSTVEVDLP